MLGLLTGAQVKEIVQLLLDDVLAADGVYYFNLESYSENGKKLKRQCSPQDSDSLHSYQSRFY